MAYIELTPDYNSNNKVMIFAEGTVLKPKSLFRLYNHKSYVPIGDCVNLISKWKQQGVEIIYCTSRKGKQALEIADILRHYNFPGSKLYFRDKGEKYKNIVEETKPNILIEDDCRSIGGNWQMCITHVEPQIKDAITSIAIREFKGLDSLPQSLSELRML